MRLIDADELIKDRVENDPVRIVVMCAPTVYNSDEVASAMGKQTPYKITYKNGFGHCKCGCEFESEGYSGEEYCLECGQKVWVGGYNGEENKIVSFTGNKGR